MENLFCFFDTCSLQSNNQRNGHIELRNGIDNSLGNNITSHDTAKDIDENCRHFGIRADNFKGISDLLSRCPTADIQKVCRLTAMEFNYVHGSHCQSSAIYYD